MGRMLRDPSCPMLGRPNQTSGQAIISELTPELGVVGYRVISELVGCYMTWWELADI